MDIASKHRKRLFVSDNKQKPGNAFKEWISGLEWDFSTPIVPKQKEAKGKVAKKESRSAK